MLTPPPARNRSNRSRSAAADPAPSTRCIRNSAESNSLRLPRSPPEFLVEGRRGELDERPEYLALGSLASPAPGRRPPQLFPYRVGLPPVAGAEQLFAVAKQPGRPAARAVAPPPPEAGRPADVRENGAREDRARDAVYVRAGADRAERGSPERGVSSRFRNPGPRSSRGFGHRLLAVAPDHELGQRFQSIPVGRRRNWRQGLPGGGGKALRNPPAPRRVRPAGPRARGFAPAGRR